VRRRRTAAAALTAALALCLATALATAEVFREGELQITVLGQIKPFKLPRTEPAPIAIFIAGHLADTKGGAPPQLKRLRIRLNRHGLLQSQGLPACHLHQIQPATTSRALTDCGEALVGSGRFWAEILLPGQPPYRTRGRLLVFNGRRAGKPVLFAHIFTTKPFATSFVLSFAIKRISRGPWGTLLSASLPESLGKWGYLDRIKLTLRRKYTYRGKQRSYLNASCPAPKGFTSAVFPLAQAQFTFAEEKHLDLTLTKNCRVKGP
jgi:hypothetical protein